MKIKRVTQQNRFVFRANLSNRDIAYKVKLLKGLKDRFGINASIESLDSVAAPDELKSLLGKFLPKDFVAFFSTFKPTPPSEIFKNILQGKCRVNLHTHTKHSDGKMNVKTFLEQSRKYADMVAALWRRDEKPPYTSAITDHNNLEATKKAIAMIAQEPQKYKNYKFVPGCELMIYDAESGLKKPTYEVVALGINPFDKELNNAMKNFLPPGIIKKVTEAGGIASYAHPLRYCQGQTINDEFIQYLLSKGVNGMEANYQYSFSQPYDISKQTEAISEITKRAGWFATGGTDAHNKNIFHKQADDVFKKRLHGMK